MITKKIGLYERLPDGPYAGIRASELYLESAQRFDYTGTSYLYSLIVAGMVTCSDSEKSIIRREAEREERWALNDMTIVKDSDLYEIDSV